MMATNLNKKTTSNCYSITIRTGNGVILGSNPVNDLVAYIRKHFKVFIFSIEKDENEAHFQGAVFTDLSSPSKRQDNLKRDLQKFVDQMYIEGLGDNLPTEKGLAAMRKFALKVRPHNNLHVLIRYVLKEGISYPNTPFMYSLPENLQYYVPEQYCIHDNVSTYCDICYKQETEETVLLPPDGYERLKYYDREDYFYRKI